MQDGLVALGMVITKVEKSPELLEVSFEFSSGFGGGS